MIERLAWNGRVGELDTIGRSALPLQARRRSPRSGRRWRRSQEQAV